MHLLAPGLVRFERTDRAGGVVARLRARPAAMRRGRSRSASPGSSGRRWTGARRRRTRSRTAPARRRARRSGGSACIPRACALRAWTRSRWACGPGAVGSMRVMRASCLTSASAVWPGRCAGRPDRSRERSAESRSRWDRSRRPARRAASSDARQCRSRNAGIGLQQAQRRPARRVRRQRARRRRHSHSTSTRSASLPNSCHTVSMSRATLSHSRAAVGRRRHRDAPRARGRIPRVLAAVDALRRDRAQVAGGCSISPWFFCRPGASRRTAAAPATSMLPKNMREDRHQHRAVAVADAVGHFGSRFIGGALRNVRIKAVTSTASASANHCTRVAAVLFRRQGVGQQLEVARVAERQRRIQAQHARRQRHRQASVARDRGRCRRGSAASRRRCGAMPVPQRDAGRRRRRQQAAQAMRPGGRATAGIARSPGNGSQPSSTSNGAAPAPARTIRYTRTPARPSRCWLSSSSGPRRRNGRRPRPSRSRVRAPDRPRPRSGNALRAASARCAAARASPASRPRAAPASSRARQTARSPAAPASSRRTRGSARGSRRALRRGCDNARHGVAAAPPEPP